jgi:uncharacterized protein (TIGR02301 family)
MRRAALLLALLPGFAVAAPAVAPRTPQARQAVADLAYALGETHALRQACLGEDDQQWRVNMTRLIETEAVDPALGPAGQRRLIEAFNAGFNARRAQFPSCRPEVQAALKAAAAKAEALARRLAGPPTDRP